MKNNLFMYVILLVAVLAYFIQYGSLPFFNNSTADVSSEGAIPNEHLAMKSLSSSFQVPDSDLVGGVGVVSTFEGDLRTTGAIFRQDDYYFNYDGGNFVKDGFDTTDLQTLRFLDLQPIENVVSGIMSETCRKGPDLINFQRVDYKFGDTDVCIIQSETDPTQQAIIGVLPPIEYTDQLRQNNKNICGEAAIEWFELMQEYNAGVSICVTPVKGDGYTIIHVIVDYRTPKGYVLWAPNVAEPL